MWKEVKFILTLRSKKMGTLVEYDQREIFAQKVCVNLAVWLWKDCQKESDKGRGFQFSEC